MRRRGRPPYPDILTPREWEVLALLREGLSNEEIAERLDISLAGAKYHVSEILGKLGVSSREEAVRWSASGGERPWWMTAFAPLGFLWRRANASWLSTVMVSALGLAVAAGIGLLVWGLVATGGGDDAVDVAGPLGRVTVIPTAPTPTARANLPPLPTPQPFVAAPINCPGGYATPEDAIEACLAVLYANFAERLIYIGDCTTPRPAPPSEAGFDRPCSSWEDGATSPRSYVISGVGSDAYDRLILQQAPDGWETILRAGCAIQRQADTDQLYELHNMDFSQVRIDDCRFPPSPLPRPTVRLWPLERRAVSNGRTELSAWGQAYYPGRGVMIGVSITNISGNLLPWTSDVGTDIALVAEDGTRFPASEVGGTLARFVAEGLAPGADWGGWLVFPIEEFGTYSLEYPGQRDMVLDLTPRREFFPSPKQ